MADTRSPSDDRSQDLFEGGDVTVLDLAGAAARDALAPTVKALQASALLLLDRMIEVGKEPVAA